MASEESSSSPEENASAPGADEDWKQRVKQEDAALDEKFRSEVESPGAGAGEKPQTSQQQSGPSQQIPPDQLPAASFETLVAMFSTQALVALGMIPDPSGNTHTQPQLARHFIDLLSVLEKKTAGNLDDRENSLLQTNLHQLRMAFVEVSKKAAATGTEDASTGENG